MYDMNGDPELPLSLVTFKGFQHVAYARQLPQTHPWVKLRAQVL